MKHLLDDIFWHALSGQQARFAAGDQAARRYAPGFSAIVAFADQLRPDLSALAAFCVPGGHFYTEGWTGAAPAGWQIKVESTMLKMIWEADRPPADEAPDTVPLNEKHAPQALELAELTHPGPFGLRTIELGEYFGVFDGPRLIAMAGERSHAGMLREISGACTHPDFQGSGLAKRLMLKLIRRQVLRNETPLLHVMQNNRVRADSTSGWVFATTRKPSPASFHEADVEPSRKTSPGLTVSTAMLSFPYFK